MLTMRVLIRNTTPMVRGGAPTYAELTVNKEVLPSGEEKEYEFTDEGHLKVEVKMTKEGEEAKKKIEEEDAAIMEEKANPPEPEQPIEDPEPNPFPAGPNP